jgi:hypothetical protein
MTLRGISFSHRGQVGNPNKTHHTAVVSAEDRSMFTLSHEIGHILTKTWTHHADKWNIMNETTSDENTVTATKRFTGDENQGQHKKIKDWKQDP